MHASLIQFFVLRHLHLAFITVGLVPYASDAVWGHHGYAGLGLTHNYHLPCRPSLIG